MSAGRYHRRLVALTASFAAVLVLWAVLMPGFRAPDEPQHYNSVMRLATGGGWPEPGTARLSDATVVATREAGYSASDMPVARITSSLLPRSSMEGWGLDFVSLTPPARTSVLDHRAEMLGDEVEPTVDQMTQHPPLYYALGALTIRAAGALDWRWDHQLLLLRLLSCLITVPAVPLVAATARRLTGSPTIALTAAAGLLAIGQLAHISSSVSNDSLTTTLGLTSTYLAARALTQPHRLRGALLAGAVLGLGLLTKGFLLAAIPMVALAFLVPTPHNPRLPRRALTAAVAMTTAFAVGGWWWLRNLLTHGSVQPPGMSRVVVDREEAPDGSAFIAQATSRLNRSFWGNFGWLEIPLPPWLPFTLGIVLAALVLAGPLVASGNRRPILVLLTFPAGTLAIVLYGAYRAYVETTNFAGLQGRYLFSTLAALLTAAALAAGVVARKLLPPALAGRLPLLALAAALASGGYALFRFFQGAYQTWDETLVDGLVRWEVWSPLSREQIAAAILAAAAAGIITLALFAGSRRRGGPLDAPPVGEAHHTPA